MLTICNHFNNHELSDKIRNLVKCTERHIEHINIAYNLQIEEKN
jgi:hypothetical protein